jgi:hypothetical protein
VSVPVPEFWKLLGASRLLSAQQVQQLAAELNQKAATDPANSKPLAQWLVSAKKISRYQRWFSRGAAGSILFRDYKVHERVERGRLAGCFRAVHTATGHPVLLHFLMGAAAGDVTLWTATSQHALALARVVSPHVQRVFEPAEAQLYKFVVCEDLRGSTLDEKLTAGRLPPAEACRIARLVAIGLASVHEARQVYGDVRPINVWLDAAISRRHPLVVVPLRAPLTRRATGGQSPGARGRFPAGARRGAVARSADRHLRSGCTLRCSPTRTICRWWCTAKLTRTPVKRSSR